MSKSKKVAKANPTKEFFVNMMVRDILLKQAIIELIDNSIDGARKLSKEKDYRDLKIELNFDKDSFSIEDNCGGIPLNIAEEYAFRFGRPSQVEENETETTGIFGIGMKRALFKIGNNIELYSKSVDTDFSLKLNVNDWLKKTEEDWDFEIDDYNENTNYKVDDTGTVIKVTELYNEISGEFQDPEFERELVEDVERRIGLDLCRGLTIVINGKKLEGEQVELVCSDELKPVKEEYESNDVFVKIVAGIAKKTGSKYAPEKSGWYLYCNDRLIVVADKTSLTTWKDIENKNSGVVFSNTYASFQGSVFFYSKKPEKLPWNTTKTGINESAIVYIEAKERMIEVFKIVRGFIDDVRKKTKEDGDGVETTVAEMPSISLTKENIDTRITSNREFSVNNINVKTISNVTIRYKKPKEEVDLLKELLGVKDNSEVGSLTFDYYKDAEC